MFILPLYQEINDLYGDSIRALASRLHNCPELSFQEHETTALLKQLLSEKGVPLLPIELETGCRERKAQSCFAGFKSKEQKVLHSFHRNRIFGNSLKGDVLLIFQPAEEKLKGARYLLDRGLWDAFKPDMLFGLHNLPSLPIGQVGVKAGPLMSFKDGFSIRYVGRSGHTSTPQKNVDPIIAIAQLITALQTVVSRNISPLEAAVLTVCSVNAGSPFTTTVDDAVITGNIRSLDSQVRCRILERVRKLAEETASAFECTAQIEMMPITEGVVNSEELLPIARNAGAAVFGVDGVVTPEVNLASEDFSLLGRGIPYFFYFLGSGTPGEQTYLWHNPHFHAHPQTPVYGAALLVSSVLAAQA